MKDKGKNENSTKRNRSRTKKDTEVKEEIYTIVLKSELKTLLSQFVETEIKKKINKINFEVSFKKQKNDFTFTFSVRDKHICDEIIEKSLSSDLYKKDEVKVYLNDEELHREIEKEEKPVLSTEVQPVHEQVLSSSPNIREITVGNIPEKLPNDKIYEIFFIYGDITKLEFNREQKKAFIRYRFCSSAEKAYKKLNLEKNKTKNLTVEMSDIKLRDGIEGDEEGSEDRNVGVVVYFKFEDADKVPEKEELKKLLKRFGMVTKIFRKREGRSYYVEFSSSASAQELIRDYRMGVFSRKGLKEVDYAFNKDVKKRNEEEVENKQQEQVNIEKDNVNNEINITQKDNVEISSDKIDPNKHWQVYYDQTYQRNYYFNPFFNQSVWDLPEGAEITPHQSNDYYYDPQGQQAEEEPAQTQLAQVENTDNNPHQNFYDEEAWEEDELVEKLVWDKMKEQQLKEWMKRPARHQVEDTRRDTAYVEGNYDYNIWYDKYLTDRKEEKEKIPALHRCSPALDTGFTKADIQEKEGGAYFCMFFAKGCCSEGVNCRYYHHVPTREEVEKIENLRDVFGRSRFANHRNDMGGVGTFTKECRSLFVSDLKLIDTANPIKEMVRVIYESFSPWGEIEDINYVPAKATCFIRFSHRCFAEFAKEATMGQSLVGEEIITVKWAYDDPNPMNKKRTEIENENRFISSYNRKQDNLAKLKEKTGNRSLPTTDYHNFYSNKNNPYGYTSGYGQEEKPNVSGYAVIDEGSQNYMKLSETLKRIDEMNQGEFDK